MRNLKRGGLILFMTAITAAAAMAQSGHDASMAKENPVPFTRDMDKAAQDIVSRVKAGRSMDAQSSVSQLSATADKLLPHITDAALKDQVKTLVGEIKTSVNSGSPDVFELEDKVQELQTALEQVRKKLQGMSH
jgi:hypothetical protein